MLDRLVDVVIRASTAADWDDWITIITDDGVNLTNWEEEFVQSVKEQRKQGRLLSERQAEILERIYADKTP